MIKHKDLYIEYNKNFLVNTIYRFLNFTKVDNLVNCINSKYSDSDFKNSSYYYCWLFQENPKFVQIINHNKINTNYILGYIYYSFGNHICKGADADVAMLLSTDFVYSKTSLNLLTEFNLIDIDVNLALILISKLNVSDFEEFTKDKDMIYFFEKVLKELDKSTFKKYFTHNESIYNQILNILQLKNNSNFYNEFMIRYGKDFQIIEEAIEVSQQVGEITHEQMIDINNQRNACLDILIKELRKKENPLDIIEILYAKGFFCDEIEKKTVEYLFTLVVV